MVYTVLHSQIVEHNWDVACITLCTNPNLAKVLYDLPSAQSKIQNTHVLPLHMALQLEAPENFIRLLVTSYPQAVITMDPIHDELPVRMASRLYYSEKIIHMLETETSRQRQSLCKISNRKKASIQSEGTKTVDSKVPRRSSFRRRVSVQSEGTKTLDSKVPRRSSFSRRFGSRFGSKMSIPSETLIVNEERVCNHADTKEKSRRVCFVSPRR